MVKSTKKEAVRDLSAEREQETVAIARAMLVIFAKKVEELPLGMDAGANPEATAKFFQKFYVEELLPLLMTANPRFIDVGYPFVHLTTLLQNCLDITTESLKMNKADAQALMWKVKDTDDLRIMDVDAKLKELAVDKPVIE